LFYQGTLVFSISDEQATNTLSVVNTIHLCRFIDSGLKHLHSS